METTKTLREEHQLILAMLARFAAALGEMRTSGSVPAGHLASFVEFFRGFADACHHCKEEDRLFPALERSGIPRHGGPIGCMLEEHQSGRGHIAAVGAAIPAAAAGDRNAFDVIVSQGDAYVELLRSHIAKEDNVLFVMADELLVGDDAASLQREFREAESGREYVETAARCRLIAEELAGIYP